MRVKPMILSLFALLFVWAVAAMAIRLPILPTPWAVIGSFVLDLPHELGWHTLVSVWRIGISTLIATMLAVPLGMILGQNKRWDNIFFPFVYLTYPVPKVALLPVIILFLGIGDMSKVFLIALILFFQVLVVVRDASRNIPSQLILSLRSLGADRLQLLRYAYFPACVPAILTSLRLNVAIAIAVLYLAESFATTSGLGYYIMDSWQRLNYVDLYSAILAMAVVGAGAFVAFALIEAKWCHWAQVGK